MTLHYLHYLAQRGAADIHPQGRLATQQLIAALALPTGRPLLEIGCGTGWTLVQVALRHDGLAYGVDVLPAMLRVARQRRRLAGLAARVGFARASGETLPFVSGTFGRVYTESVLGFQQPLAARQMLGEVHRVLAPGGRFVANEAVWKQGVTAEKAAAIYAASVADFGLSQASEQPWGVDAWVALAREVGFAVRSVDRLEALPPSTAPARLSWRGQLAGALTWYYRLRARFSLRMRRARVAYSEALARHGDDGQYIEARLLVWEKVMAD